MYTYRAFGHTFSSEIRLPELRRPDERSDESQAVRIRRGSVARRPDASFDAETGIRERYEADTTYLSHPDVGRIRISDGTTITVDAVTNPNPEQLRQFVLGPAVRIVMHQRGHLVVHGSAVEIDGEGIVFVGESGAGKSTLAAACYDAGYGVLADDIVVPQRSNGDVVVPPAFPHLKLDRAAAGVVDGANIDTKAPVDRSYHETGNESPKLSVPLGRIYLVEPVTNDDPVGADHRAGTIEPVSPGEGTHALLQETFSTYGVDDVRAAATHLERCSELSSEVPIRRLRRPDGLETLSDVVQTIADDGGADADDG